METSENIDLFPIYTHDKCNMECDATRARSEGYLAALDDMIRDLGYFRRADADQENIARNRGDATGQKYWDGRLCEIDKAIKLAQYLGEQREKIMIQHRNEK